MLNRADYGALGGPGDRSRARAVPKLQSSIRSCGIPTIEVEQSTQPSVENSRNLRLEGAFNTEGPRASRPEHRDAQSAGRLSLTDVEGEQGQVVSDAKQCCQMKSV